MRYISPLGVEGMRLLGQLANRPVVSIKAVNLAAGPAGAMVSADRIYVDSAAHGIVIGAKAVLLLPKLEVFILQVTAGPEAGPTRPGNRLEVADLGYEAGQYWQMFVVQRPLAVPEWAVAQGVTEIRVEDVIWFRSAGGKSILIATDQDQPEGVVVTDRWETLSDYDPKDITVSAV